ncbi:MAG TPA: tail fiber domain-containing protein [Thermoanaerobaculia bacterium]|nr:tail fiber domain-containing protein [Thermoanaerobaculia bacterium]
MPIAALAAPNEAVGHMIATPASIEWQSTAAHDAVTLTVSGPNGFTMTKEFSGNAMVRLQDLGALPNGIYTYELRVVPHISTDVKHQLAVARGANDDAAIERIQASAGLNNLPYQSGAFTVANGAFISPDLSEAPRGITPNTMSVPSGSAATGSRSVAPPVKVQDVVTADDIIVQGSACIGLDCVNNESFGFDTIKLKENNTRIHFDDTSSSSGFPNVNWQLTANDSASGGANKFSIDDLTNAKTPFTVTAAAPTNSVFVASTGKIGFGNNNPGLNLHITATDTPAIRMEQTNGGGFTAQTWDIGANEANWFVRDLTGGSRLPFRIRPGAPTSSVDIAASGNVGIGTASPNARLHSHQTTNSNFELFDSTGAFGTVGVILESLADDNTTLEPAFYNASRHVFFNGNIGIGVIAPTNPIQHSSGAALTAGGVWTNASSRALKENITDLGADEAKAAFDQLAPVKYDYKVDPSEKHVGFIAEDVPELVAMKGHKSLSPLDIVAVLTKVVQEQQKTIDDLTSRLKKVEGEVQKSEN